MSNDDARTVLKREIDRLTFTQNEKTSLRRYFTENKDRQEDAAFFLPDTDDEKIEYFRSLISPPEQSSATTLGKRKAVEDLLYPNTRPYPEIRRWTVNGVIPPIQRTNFYYADPMETNENFVKRILEGEFVALHGPRASGKTTRVYRTMQQLKEHNCHCFYITLQSVDTTNTDRFWVDIGRTLQIFNDNFFQCAGTVNTSTEFSCAFNKWTSVVIFVDEFDGLYSATDSVLNSFLNCIRTIKHAAKANKNYSILSVVAVGTFGILNLDSSNIFDSPFNIQEPLQNPNLSREQVRRLFEEFESDRKIKIDPKVIEDIYLQTNGHASMVCLCGDLIEKTKTQNFIFESWKNLVFTSLNKSIHGYRTFHRIVDDLLKDETRSAVDLLRLKFLPNPDPVNIISTQDLAQAHYLARHGVLITVDNGIDTFMMSSPLLRSVILRYVLPNIFKYCPSVEIPRHLNQNIDILSALRYAVCVFDKNNIQLAAVHSHKTAQVSVGRHQNVFVPRESVYQQQLAAIFTNWISSLGFEIMSQYHITEGNTHRYSDLIITAPSTYPNQPTVILELLATSTKKQLDEHFDCTLGYAQSLKKKLSVCDVWVIHFTCQDNPNDWPSEDQRKKGLNAVIFWHNLDFTKVYMSARWINDQGKYAEMKKQYIIG